MSTTTTPFLSCPEISPSSESWVSYTLFDFGKREHTIKERNAQVGMAETALELTKAKVATAVKTSYFEMDRSRQLSELARRMSAAISVRDVSYRVRV